MTISPRKLLLPLLALCAFSISLIYASAAEALKPGDKAPTFTAKDQNGKTFHLSHFIGKKIVLVYFYPRDDTPGCTKEACGFRDRIGDLQKDNVEVVGISFDSAESHQKFIAKYNLNFPLLVDTTGKIADKYGVRMTGKNMARRVSFLIGLDGRIVHITDNPKAEVHLAEMQEAAAKLKKG